MRAFPPKSLVYPRGCHAAVAVTLRTVQMAPQTWTMESAQCGQDYLEALAHWAILWPPRSVMLVRACCCKEPL